MSLHHQTLKKAAKKYADMPFETEIALHSSIVNDEAGYTDEDIREIIAAVKALKQSKPVTEAMEALQPKQAAPPGKNLYDKWRGQWRSIRHTVNPYSGDIIHLEWEFERLDTKANKTGIPLTEHEAGIFNNTRRLSIAGVPTEQLYLAGNNDVIRYKNERFKDFVNNVNS